MTIALRQPLPLTDAAASDQLASGQTRPEAGVAPRSYDAAQEQKWSFQRMIAVTGVISVVLWLGLGALVWKALS